MCVCVCVCGLIDFWWGGYENLVGGSLPGEIFPGGGMMSKSLARGGGGLHPLPSRKNLLKHIRVVDSHLKQLAWSITGPPSYIRIFWPSSTYFFQNFWPVPTFWKWGACHVYEYEAVTQVFIMEAKDFRHDNFVWFCVYKDHINWNCEVKSSILGMIFLLKGFLLVFV